MLRSENNLISKATIICFPSQKMMQFGGSFRVAYAPYKVVIYQKGGLVKSDSEAPSESNRRGLIHHPWSPPLFVSSDTSLSSLFIAPQILVPDLSPPPPVNLNRDSREKRRDTCER